MEPFNPTIWVCEKCHNKEEIINEICLKCGTTRKDSESLYWRNATETRSPDRCGSGPNPFLDKNKAFL